MNQKIDLGKCLEDESTVLKNQIFFEHVCSVEGFNKQITINWAKEYSGEKKCPLRFKTQIGAGIFPYFSERIESLFNPYASSLWTNGRETGLEGSDV